MILLYFISVILAFLYIFLMSNILTSWNEIHEWSYNEKFSPETFFTVIIPFRNEEDYLFDCVESVLSANYPRSLYEIILINDFSDDQSLERIQAFLDKVKLIQLEGPTFNSNESNKKMGIDKAIREAEGDWIITLDADCTVPSNWFMTFASYLEYNNKEMVVGMVMQDGKKSLLNYFQIMDTCGTMGVQGAGIRNKNYFLANGANLAYKKSTYLDLNPFSDNYDKSSGDDIFFIQKLSEKRPESIGFLKSIESAVTTQTEKSWTSLFQQRKRWATKHKGMKKSSYKKIAAFVWVFYVSLIINLLLVLFHIELSIFILLTQLFILGIMNYLYLQNMCRYFNQGKTLKYYIPSLFLYIFFIFTSGYFALKGGTYFWKGRKVR